MRAKQFAEFRQFFIGKILYINTRIKYGDLYLMGFTYLQPVNSFSNQLFKYNNNFTAASPYYTNYTDINSVHGVEPTGYNSYSTNAGSTDSDAQNKDDTSTMGSYNANLILSILQSESLNNKYGYSDLLKLLANTPTDSLDYNNILSLLKFPLTFETFNSYANTPKCLRWTYGKNKIMNFNTTTNLPALKDVYNPQLANKFADIAYQNALITDTRGWCARGVRIAAENANLGEIRVASAFQADNVLENNKNFKKVDIPRDKLREAPAGCVIVWEPYTDDKGNYHQHGHIAVTLGLIPDPKDKTGKKMIIGEASDHVQELSIKPSNFTVFVPVENKKSGKK